MVLDDEPSIGKVVRQNLTADRFNVEAATHSAPVLERLREGRADWHVVILDVILKGDTVDGIDVLRELRRFSNLTSVVMLSGQNSAEMARTCWQLGAYDYLLKPVRGTELSAVISLAADHANKLRATAGVPVTRLDDLVAPALIGTSPPMMELRRKIWQVASSNTSVLIHGETGTGKELVAHAIHQHSQRRQRKFVPINCGALADSLIDSALFGHVRGAFTGAFDDHPGAFVEANGGTLFLDEIGDMPRESQPLLLRAVQGEVRPVGASADTRVDVRLISATHIDLQAAVREFRFREDLFYRLQVVPLLVPSLRERLEDIPLLAEHFLRKHLSTLKGPKFQGPPPKLAPSTLEILTSFAWPGNVRQLENTIQCALALCEGGSIYPSHLPADIVSPRHVQVARGTRAPTFAEDEDDGDDEPPELPPPPDVMFETAADGSVLPMGEAMRRENHRIRVEYMDRLLRETNGNLTQAARKAGVDRANFRRNLRALGIDPALYRPKKN